MRLNLCIFYLLFGKHICYTSFDTNASRRSLAEAPRSNHRFLKYAALVMWEMCRFIPQDSCMPESRLKENISDCECEQFHLGSHCCEPAGSALCLLSRVLRVT